MDYTLPNMVNFNMSKNKDVDENKKMILQQFLLFSSMKLQIITNQVSSFISSRYNHFYASHADF